MKATPKIVLILSGIGISIVWLLSGVFKQLEDMPQVRHKTVVRRGDTDQKKYINGTEEVVTFFAREKGDSSHMIARKALLIKRPGAEAIVFLFHGFMCNKYDSRFLGNALFGTPINGKPINIMLIDFRAHGDLTENQCCSFGYNEKYDVMGAVDFVRAHPELKDLKRIAYGFSMGAVAAILAQSQDPELFNALVLDCPFESTENMLGRAVERLKVTAFGHEVPLPGRDLLKKYAYNSYVQSLLKVALKAIAQMDACQVETCIMPVDTVAAMKKVSAPSMLIACRKDSKAPPSAVKEVYDAASGYKRFWITNGRNHFDSYFYNPEKYTYKVRRFIQKILDGSYKDRYQAYIFEDDVEE